MPSLCVTLISILNPIPTGLLHYVQFEGVQKLKLFRYPEAKTTGNINCNLIYNRERKHGQTEI